MKIQDKQKETKELLILKPGDVFRFEGNIYILFEDKNVSNANSIRLADGKPFYFVNSIKVEPVNCTLIVD
jgi:hypothetical protein